MPSTGSGFILPAVTEARAHTRPPRRLWRRLLWAAVLAGILTPIGLVLWSGWTLASPTRRPLMDYHRDYLSNPAAHGLKIDSFTAADGTPCLVCVPDPAGRLADRGTRVRNQIVTRHLTLEPPGRVIGTLVLLHGRNGRKEDYLPIAERLCAVGFRCLIPDLPAHGDHPGVTATYGIREAALPACILAEAAAKFGFDPRPAGLLGMSMGGSVAVHATALPGAPWRALVVISSFDDFPAVISDQAVHRAGLLLGPPWAAGAAAVFRFRTGIPLDTIQPRNHAAAIRIPTFIAHGTADTVIPAAAGRRLFDSLPATTRKQWTPIPGADHNNVLITDFPIYADIAAWMLQNVP